MADPTGANFSTATAQRIDGNDPNFQSLKLAQRVQALRTDVDNPVFGAVNCPASTTTTLTAAQSGSVVLLAPNAAICVLPAASAGLNYIIVSTGAYATATSYVSTSAGTVHFRGGSNARDGSDCATPGATDDRAEFQAGTVPGDHIEVICLSATSWLVRGSSKTASSITYTDGGS